MFKGKSKAKNATETLFKLFTATTETQSSDFSREEDYLR